MMPPCIQNSQCIKSLWFPNSINGDAKYLFNDGYTNADCNTSLAQNFIGSPIVTVFSSYGPVSFSNWNSGSFKVIVIVTDSDCLRYYCIFKFIYWKSIVLVSFTTIALPQFPRFLHVQTDISINYNGPSVSSLGTSLSIKIHIPEYPVNNIFKFAAFPSSDAGKSITSCSSVTLNEDLHKAWIIHPTNQSLSMSTDSSLTVNNCHKKLKPHQLAVKHSQFIGGSIPAVANNYGPETVQIHSEKLATSAENQLLFLHPTNSPSTHGTPPTTGSLVHPAHAASSTTRASLVYINYFANFNFNFYFGINTLNEVGVNISVYMDRKIQLQQHKQETATCGESNFLGTTGTCFLDSAKETATSTNSNDGVNLNFF
ncbi:hypothetical protein ACTA71_012257 [Dictyostelium dimigraforme]